jgi:hypothetical protein
MLKPGQ